MPRLPTLGNLALLVLLQGGTALDFYRELGVRRGANQADIKQAYREAAKRYHPDKNKDVAAQSKFQKIAQAYETLSDPEKRRLYDMHGEDYANVQQQQQHQNQFQRRQQDMYDPFGQYRRRPQVAHLAPHVPIHATLPLRRISTQIVCTRSRTIAL